MVSVEKAQTAVLRSLLKKAEQTVVGRSHGFGSVVDPLDFSQRVQLSTYPDIEPYITRAKSGEPDVLWPGVVRRFAVSSGTTGKGKHLPVTDDRLKSDLRFMRRVSAAIVRDRFSPSLFLGRHAALSGSVEEIGGLQMGEISGMLACASPWWARGLHCLCPAKASRMDWRERYEALVQKTMHADLRVISGVPSWLLLFFKEVSERRGRSLSEVWPNLKLVITGGVALSGYLKALRALLHPLNVQFLENYGASEGYYAFGWQSDGNMALQYDQNIYYELLPYHLSNAVAPGKTKPLPLWQAQAGASYNLVVTNNAGLWRYVTNDVITFDTVDPPRIRVTGRANEMTDTFGEALTAIEAREAFRKAWSGPPPDALHVISGWDETSGLPRHTWLVAYQTNPLPNVLPHVDDSQTRLDAELQQTNRHYQIRRATGALLTPRIQILDGPAYMVLLSRLPKSQSKLGMFLEG